MKIAVFNVKFSENLGDGILAECLERTIASCGAEVQTIDLAGRTAYARTGNRRGIALRALQTMPGGIRRTVVRGALHGRLKSLAPQWAGAIESADAVVIGGGNLFQDDDLNFPLKIAAVLDCARRTGRPLAIYAVGVSDRWSPAAKRLFDTLQDTAIAHVSVRDERARENWRRHFPDGPQCRIVPDPGVLAASLNRTALAENPGARGPVGICVTDPVILKRHASRASAAIALSTPDEYAELALRLVAAGHAVRFFTNGASEDHSYAERVAALDVLGPAVAAGAISTARHPGTPGELVSAIMGMRAIVAHRLHASIVAYSAGVPHVGLGWDDKVRGFFEAVDRGGFFADGSMATPERLAGLVDLSLKTAWDAGSRERITGFARSSIVSMVAELERHRATATGRKPRDDGRQSEYRPGVAAPGVNAESGTTSFG